MPIPNTPIAKPRRAGGYHPATCGTPTANAVPPIPRKKPATIMDQYESWTNAKVSTGTIVARLTSGNIIRAPYRSVSAPTGMRPTEPTTTGTATSSDWAAKPSPSRSLRPGPSGPSSAHAQKLTMKPTVARTRLAVVARLVTAAGSVVGRVAAAAGSALGVFIVVIVGLGGC